MKKLNGIRQRAVSSLKWTTVSQAGRFSTQFLGMLILSHLLPPSDFGILAMASIVIGFASLFRDFGTTAAIIQTPNPHPSLLTSIFWLNIFLGMGLAASLCLLLPLITIGFDQPSMGRIVWILALTFPIVSLGTVHQALLEKASRFRVLAIIEFVAALISVTGAVWAALSGWGVYSLVLQAVVSAFVTATALWIVSRWKPSFHYDSSEIRKVMGFTRNLVGFNVVNYFIRNADNLLIGRFLGASDLGYYSMAYRLMLWPLQNISAVVARALLPMFSEIQADPDKIAGAYTRATAAVMFLTAPIMFGFFVLREPLVNVALGAQWRPCVSILAWLVPVGLLQSIGTLVGSLYLATGRTDVMFKWGVAAAFLIIPAFLIGMEWGVIGVAIAYAFASLLLFLPGLAIPFRLVGLRVADVLLRLVPPIATSTAMALVVGVCAVIWGAADNDQTFRLLSLIAIGMVTYGGLSYFTQRDLLRDIIRVVLNR